MSSYGTAVLIDLPGSGGVAEMVEALQGIDADCPVSVQELGPWTRIATYSLEIDIADQLLQSIDGTEARIAIAEDNDEFGALWLVASAADGAVQTIHRRYILNADLNDADGVAAAISELGEDPRVADIAGPAAAAAAAVLFETDVDDAVAAEAHSGTAHERIGIIGIIGGPFPWWDALRLPWPHR